MLHGWLDLLWPTVLHGTLAVVGVYVAVLSSYGELLGLGS
jgi:hypothetical protein